MGRPRGPALHVSYFFWYFQCLVFPSDIHSTALANRFFRVSSVLASVIQSTYSFLLVRLNPSNVAYAFLFFLRAAVSSAGTSSSFFSIVFGRGAGLIPAS